MFSKISLNIECLLPFFKLHLSTLIFMFYVIYYKRYLNIEITKHTCNAG